MVGNNNRNESMTDKATSPSSSHTIESNSKSCICIITIVAKETVSVIMLFSIHIGKKGLRDKGMVRV